VRLIVPQDSYQVDEGSTSGTVSVEVAQDPHAPRQLYANTAAGDVDIRPI
jgi:hypothetical protein